MPNTLIGFTRSAGKWTPDGESKEKDYDNLKLFSICEFNSMRKETIYGGQNVEVLKIKNNEQALKSVFGFLPKLDDLNKFIGMQFNISYDRFGNVAKITFTESA